MCRPDRHSAADASTVAVAALREYLVRANGQGAVGPCELARGPRPRGGVSGFHGARHAVATDGWESQLTGFGCDAWHVQGHVKLTDFGLSCVGVIDRTDNLNGPQVGKPRFCAVPRLRRHVKRNSATHVAMLRDPRSHTSAAADGDGDQPHDWRRRCRFPCPRRTRSPWTRTARRRTASTPPTGPTGELGTWRSQPGRAQGNSRDVSCGQAQPYEPRAKDCSRAVRMPRRGHAASGAREPQPARA
jgi:hypothetical protein